MVPGFDIRAGNWTISDVEGAESTRGKDSEATKLWRFKSQETLVRNWAGAILLAFVPSTRW